MGKKEDEMKTERDVHDKVGKEKEVTYDLEDNTNSYVSEPEAAYRAEWEEEPKDGRLQVIQGGLDGKVEDKTIEDYMALPEGTRVELIDGVFYDMACPTSIHMDIQGRIYMELMNFVMKNKGSCRPYIAPLDVQLDCDDKTMVQPDVLIVCDKKQKIFPWVVGAPDFVVEVVSPSNRKMDVIKKRYKYERAGVREYWMVFPEEKKITVCLFKKGIEKDYTFADRVPVEIWDGRLEIDFTEIDAWLEPLYQQMKEQEG